MKLEAILAVEKNEITEVMNAFILEDWEKKLKTKYKSETIHFTTVNALKADTKLDTVVAIVGVFDQDNETGKIY